VALYDAGTRAMQKRYRNYVNGRWETGVTTSTSENPSDLAAPVGEYARADRQQAELAVRAAAEAAPAWAYTTPQRRADALDRIGTELLARKDELGDLLAREEGKTLAEAITEVARAGNIFKFFAGEALRSAGEKLDSVRPGVEVDITREPVGVIGIIAPWNYPLASSAAPACRLVRSTSSMAAAGKWARPSSRAHTSMRSASPARRQPARRFSKRLQSAASRCSSRWAARIRSSCSPTPSSTRPSTARCRAHSIPPGSAARRRAG
jgi:hypothetical protein